ncbi:MAG: YraN family protein [Bacteroidales bacterium]
MPTSDRIILGKLGEDLACCELERRGYAIVARGYRTRVGELDIVARDGDTLVFVEVKTRRSADYGLPREAVSRRKQRKVWLMALDFVMRAGWHNRACRFDVVEVQMLDSGDALLEVIPDAFEACE